MLFQVVKVLTRSSLSLVPALVPLIIPACKLAAGIHLVNILQKVVFSSCKFLKDHTPRKPNRRSLRNLQSKSPAQFYSSSKKPLKPRRTVQFKLKPRLRRQKHLEELKCLTSRTFSRVKEDARKEPVYQVPDDQAILELIVKNFSPCNCPQCLNANVSNNNFEPMVFTHSTPLKVNETFEGSDDVTEEVNGTRNAEAGDFENKNDLDGISTSASSDDYEDSPLREKKMIKPDYHFLANLQKLYAEEDDEENSARPQSDEMAVDTISDEVKNEVEKDLEGSLRSMSSSSSDFIIYRRDSPLSSDEDEQAVNSSFTDYIKGSQKNHTGATEESEIGQFNVQLNSSRLSPHNE